MSSLIPLGNIAVCEHWLIITAEFVGPCLLDEFCWVHPQFTYQLIFPPNKPLHFENRFAKLTNIKT